MPHVDKHKPPFCDELPAGCSFERKGYPAGATVQNEATNINYLLFCQSGHARISSTLFHDAILCAGEVMFVPRGSECCVVALSVGALLVHKLTNTVCRPAQGILTSL